MTSEQIERAWGRRVMVCGYYGFANGGDEAISLAIAEGLAAQRASAVFLSANPEHTAKLTGARAISRTDLRAILREMNEVDTFLLGGGGLLQDKTSWRNLVYYLGLLRLAKARGLRAAVFNQSIGPLSERGKSMVKAALNGVPAVVRDRQSQALLHELGIDAALGGDPALLLSSAMPKNAAGEVIIAPRGDVTASLPALQGLTTRLRGHGISTLAVAYMPTEDGAAAHALGADRTLVTADPQQLLDATRGARFVVGVRLHALILAAAAEVPFAGLSYDPKVEGFCNDARSPAFAVQTEAETLLEAVLAAPAPAAAAISEMRLRAAQSFSWALGGPKA